MTASAPDPAPRPSLSVVLATIDNYQRIEKTLEHYRAQTARAELEVLIAASSNEDLQLNPAVAEEFFDLRVIEVGEIHSLSAAKALAVAEAKADWVVFGEDHSWPEPTWAEAIIAAHREGYALVGPLIKNANPGSILSWTNYLACFSRWSHSGMAGQVPQTPWHNTSYRRADLMERQDDLRRLLAVEGILQDELREKGHRAYLLPEVSTNHINISRLLVLGPAGVLGRQALRRLAGRGRRVGHPTSHRLHRWIAPHPRHSIQAPTARNSAVDPAVLVDAEDPSRTGAQPPLPCPGRSRRLCLGQGRCRESVPRVRGPSVRGDLGEGPPGVGRSAAEIRSVTS